MIAKIAGPGHQISQYEISDREMAAGSTLGSPKATMLIKATGALEKLYSPEAGIEVFGTLVLHHWDPRSGIPLTPMPGDFVIHPYHQERFFELSNHVSVHEDLFLLSGVPRGEDLHDVDPPAAYYAVELQNDSDEAVDIATYASIRLRGGFGEDTETAYDAERNAFVVCNAKMPKLVRIAACSAVPRSYEVTLDSAKTSAVQFPGELANATLETSDDPIGIFHLEHHLNPGERAGFYFVLTFSLDGENAAKQTLANLPDAKRALDRTHEHYDLVLGRAVVVTPDREVNRGVLWAKANMLRVQSLTSQGWAFVNDPTRSNNSVARDTAWFGFGADYITPHLSRDLLLWYADHLERSGMVVEYFDIRNGKTEDYGLNINDDTPLIIIALWHHYNITGDREFLEYVYPKAQRAARYILSQRNKQGLVWCKANGTADWGIAGWRNVIKGYRLAGATTELNSECYAGLKTMSMMAHELGDVDEERFFAAEADTLRKAINEHLFDKNRNLYYLNIDLDGTPRTDVTSDLVFPVMFGVADHDVAANIIARLSTPEFWSEAGLHTVPRNDIHYGPTHGDGLLGGIWAGPTFWFAFAAAAFNPEFMAYALSASFRHYSQDPRRNNTVPGQFSEWLHGETLTNQGMMLSPWFPPKYLWAAVEGAAGLDLSVSPPTLSPRPANAWEWIGVHNVTLRGKTISWFVVRAGEMRIYANYPFESVDAQQRYDEDITDDVHVSGDAAVRLALQRPDRTAIFIGNTSDRTITTSVRVNNEHVHGRYVLRSYNTLRREWTEEQAFEAQRLRVGLPVNVNRRGFSVLELHRESA
jgi:hypothetical protein